MNPDIISSLLWEDEPASDDGDTVWEDEDHFELTDEDCEVMERMGWEPEDLPSYPNQDRYRRYLTKKQ